MTTTRVSPPPPPPPAVRRERPRGSSPWPLLGVVASFVLVMAAMIWALAAHSEASERPRDAACVAAVEAYDALHEATSSAVAGVKGEVAAGADPARLSSALAGLADMLDQPQLAIARDRCLGATR